MLPIKCQDTPDGWSSYVLRKYFHWQNRVWFDNHKFFFHWKSFYQVTYNKATKLFRILFNQSIKVLCDFFFSFYKTFRFNKTTFPALWTRSYGSVLYWAVKPSRTGYGWLCYWWSEYFYNFRVSRTVEYWLPNVGYLNFGRFTWKLN